MNKEKVSEYLQKTVQKWISHAVLIGFVGITSALFYVAYQAQAIGSHYNEKSDRSTLNDLLEDVK